MTVSQLLDRLSAINESMGFDMRAALKLAPKPKVVEQQPPPRPAPPAPAQAAANRRPPPPR